MHYYLFQRNKSNILIHVSLRRVVLTANAGCQMDKACALVYLNTEGHHQIADQNVSLVLNVLRIKPAETKNACRLALDHAEKMLTAGSLITVLYAHVRQDLQEIHSRGVIQ